MVITGLMKHGALQPAVRRFRRPPTRSHTPARLTAGRLPHRRTFRETSSSSSRSGESENGADQVVPCGSVGVWIDRAARAQPFYEPFSVLPPPKVVDAQRLGDSRLIRGGAIQRSTERVRPVSTPSSRVRRGKESAAILQTVLIPDTLSVIQDSGQ